jgi:hypothetical protein
MVMVVGMVMGIGGRFGAVRGRQDVRRRGGVMGEGGGVEGAEGAGGEGD